MSLLKVTAVHKAYGAIRAVDGVSFEVQSGEIFGVIGPNGSGKTTLFNAMLGQIPLDSGTVELRGKNITGARPESLSLMGVGRTFQTLQVFGKMSVRDNLLVAAQEHSGSMFQRLFAPSDCGLGSRADDLIQRFQLAHVAQSKAGQLSYGQQKLVDIAMAFMPKPSLVLLDEPCAGVNPALVGNIREMLRSLNADTQCAFVVIEHNMDFVMGLCHRVMVMAEGKVLAIGTPAEIKSNQAVLDAYLGSDAGSDS